MEKAVENAATAAAMAGGYHHFTPAERWTLNMPDHVIDAKIDKKVKEKLEGEKAKNKDNSDPKPKVKQLTLAQAQ